MKGRKEQADLKARLLECGINIVSFHKTKKHMKVFIEANGTRSFITVGSTISDHRAIKNIISDAKHNLAEANQRLLEQKVLNLPISKESILRLLHKQDMEPVGAIEFYETEEGSPLVRLMVSDRFTALDPLEKVGFLLAASHVSFAAAKQISADNPDLEDEISDLVENIEIEPMVQKLNS